MQPIIGRGKLTLMGIFMAKVAEWVRREWPPLRLLLATIAIPLAAAILWYGREPLAGLAT
ncbi:MAG: hypothetical protein N3A66_02255 [Planctomycetota bacterium]|nr:hypothetical protein [Planctomycetota bacterium]